METHFKKFMEFLKKIHLKVPFTETLTQILSYAKFLKEIISNKRKLKDHETVAVTLDSSFVIQNMVIPKLKELRSFYIPCHIGIVEFERALCDLRVSVSWIPLSVCKKLDMGDMKLTNVSLQIADRSVKYHIGLLEDVPVRVEEYYVML